MRIMVATIMAIIAGSAFAQQWNAPDRGAKVDALAPGRNIPSLTRDNLFLNWTREREAQWLKDHPGYDPATEYPKLAAAAPTDASIADDFPRHISPFGQVRSGKAEEYQTEGVLVTYCPFCQSRSFRLNWDPANAYHATTGCCKTELYGKNFPADYPLKPTTTVKFLHLDDTYVEVPTTVYRDKSGVEWNLYIKTVFDHRRWVRDGGDLVKQLGQKFGETGDPLCAYKIAAILDQVADTYYGLPLAFGSKICMGKDGKGLTRAEWEGIARPAIFEVGELGPWSKRRPYDSPGWLNMLEEHIWAEPFGRVRHHPAFKYYSQAKYGNPEALDKRVTEKIMRELCLMFKGCFSQKLLNNYQEANYVKLWLLGILAEDPVLIDFAGPAQEVAMYNHTYQDGLNGEGAPNYMAMPGGYFYPFMGDPKGWLEYYPKFLEEQPFYQAASTELRKLNTLRGLQVEFGDQHEYIFPSLNVNPDAVRAAEKIGSRNWAGYGVGIMRIGGPGHRQEHCLTYTRASLHNAQDALGLDCWFDGVPVFRRGGYCAYWSNAQLQWERPEYKALREMGYPKQFAQAGAPPDNWSWNYSHSPLCQGNLTVDEVGVGAGWDDNRGYGEVVTFKGGEAAGEPGSGFQVLDVLDHYSWSRVDRKMDVFRRTLIGVEGPDGRPYTVDILKAKGEGRQQLYQSAFADTAAEDLPAVKGQAETLEKLYFGDKRPANDDEKLKHRVFEQVRDVKTLSAPEKPWSVTWETDLGEWGPRDVGGKPYQRPWPGDVGKAQLRLIGLPQAGVQSDLVRGKGPYIGWLKQPLPGGQSASGNVAVVDGRDFVIERRLPAAGQKTVDAQYVHILEGFREGEQSVVKSVTRLVAKSVKGEERAIVALQLAMAGGHTDTVIYQSAPGTVKLPSGVETDARYALLRQDAKGEVVTSEICRGTYITGAGNFSASMAGDFTGTIVDVIGDLTGTRTESALIIKPDSPWPAGGNLHDRQLLVRYESDLRNHGNEGYRLDKVTQLPDGNVRVDVQDHAPFVVSWHQVSVLPADQPAVIKTWRPMVDHGNNPWYNGLKLWFPGRGKLYTIKNVNRVGGGYGGDTVEVVEKVDLAREGIKPGDWYVIYGVRPGLKVQVAGDFCFREDPAQGWKQYSLRATGPVTVKCPAMSGAVNFRAGEGTWQQAAAGRSEFPAEASGKAYSVVVGKPAWLNLNDAAAPAVAKLTIDGKETTAETAAKLGVIDTPKTIVLEVADADNPLDPASLRVTLDGKAVGDQSAKATTEGKSLRLELDLQGALAAGGGNNRKHTIEVTVADRSVSRHVAVVPISFVTRLEQEKGAIYLSDLTPISFFVHGSVGRDTDYVGNPCTIRGIEYGKCLTTCPEPSGDGPHGEVVFQLPAITGPLTLHSDIGISDSSLGNGSAAFEVQAGEGPKGPWKTLLTSNVMTGSMSPQTIKVPLGTAKYLRLWTTDGGDGISSDHAVWGEARLKVGE